MDIYQKIGQISGQFFFGAGFGIIGSILSIIIADFYHGRLDPFGIGYYGFIGFYIGNPIGVNFDGYKLLRNLGEHKKFFRHFLQSIVGTISGVTLLYFGLPYLNIPELPRFLYQLIISLSIPIIPLAGATIGFNFGFPHGAKTGDHGDTIN